jgi:hypothetical protein
MDEAQANLTSPAFLVGIKFAFIPSIANTMHRIGDKKICYTASRGTAALDSVSQNPSTCEFVPVGEQFSERNLIFPISSNGIVRGALRSNPKSD